MSEEIDHEFKTTSDQPSKDTEGYWHTISHIFLKDIIVKEAGKELARLHDINSAVQVWWQGGPQHYRVVYAHSVTPISAKAKLSVELKFLNQGGGLIKKEIVEDSVSCTDTAKRTNWSFQLSEEQADIIKRFAPLVITVTESEPC